MWLLDVLPGVLAANIPTFAFREERYRYPRIAVPTKADAVEVRHGVFLVFCWPGDGRHSRFLHSFVRCCHCCRHYHRARVYTALAAISHTQETTLF
jgi:hypothetical protein